MKNKSVEKWIASLPKELRNDTIINPLMMYHTKVDRLSKAIYCLNWYESKQGGEFWMGFYEAIKWAEND
jgi:hypothetical protein